MGDVSWTKKFSSSDDGNVLTGAEIGDIQDDINERTKFTDTDEDTGWLTEKSTDEDILRAKIAGTEQLQIEDGKVLPTTNNDIDLGDATHRFKKAYINDLQIDYIFYENDVVSYENEIVNYY